MTLDGHHMTRDKLKASLDLMADVLLEPTPEGEDPYLALATHRCSQVGRLLMLTQYLAGDLGVTEVSDRIAAYRSAGFKAREEEAA